jgi:hypothetical protein
VAVVGWEGGVAVVAWPASPSRIAISSGFCRSNRHTDTQTQTHTGRQTAKKSATKRLEAKVKLAYCS